MMVTSTSRPHAILILIGMWLSPLLLGIFGLLTIKISWEVYPLTIALPFDHCFTSHYLLKQGKPSKTTFFIGWKPLPLGFFKLNTNGFACGNLGKASVGGLIRICIESWLVGFSRSIHFMVVELWGLYYDVAIA